MGFLRRERGLCDNALVGVFILESARAIYSIANHLDNNNGREI
jgi:hypothetical protein